MISKNPQQLKNFYSGGLAEIVSNPTRLTYSFLEYLFTGKESLGKAMKLLNLPYEDIDLPILKLYNDELVIDLNIEEKTLYKKTIFEYQKQKHINDTPKLILNYKKLVHPLYCFNTAKILLQQSLWIAKPTQVVTKANTFLAKIPKQIVSTDIKDIDYVLKDNIWPYVIAIGTLSEFFYQFVNTEAKKLHIETEINMYISTQVAKRDWFLKSLADQIKVKEKKLSFEEYIKEYGFRSDKDYELNCPRWWENIELLKKRIIEYKHRESSISIHEISVDKKLKSYIETLISLQIFRSEAKQYSLIFMNALRQAIIHKVKTNNILNFTREELINETFKKAVHASLVNIDKKKSKVLSSNKGMDVSIGIVSGKSKIIKNNNENIPPDTIGIFPNASPEFAPQYTKCKGMIFLKGGQTSHGAIVAREFGIPAIIDDKADSITNNVYITIDGSKGTWGINKV